MASDNEVLFKINMLTKLDNLEKMIGGFERAAQKAGLLNKSIDNTSQSLKGKFATSSRSLNQLNSVLQRTTQLYRASTDPERMKAYAGMIEKVRGRMESLEKETQTCKKSTEDLLKQDGGGFLSKYKNIGIAALSVGVARGVWNIGKDASEAAAAVEQYNATLKTMLGSTGAARDRMQEYFNLAKKTPFDLQEVVEGGNKLQAIGRYSAQNLTMLGDLAAATGKPMEQAIDAYSKLASGQKGQAVVSFRNLLISTNDWAAATGKAIDKNGELKASTEDMIKALPKIMSGKGYFGMMANQANTTKGKMANLEDGIFQLKVALGERLNPSVNKFTDYAGKSVEKIQKWVEIPLEQKIAAERFEVNALMKELIENNDVQDKRKTIIDELNQKYPEILKNIDLEKATTEELRRELEKVNGEYDKRIEKAIWGSMIDDLKEKYKEKVGDALGYKLAQQAAVYIQQTKKEFQEWAKEQNFQYVNPDGKKVKDGVDITHGGMISTSRVPNARLSEPLTPEQDMQIRSFAAKIKTAQKHTKTYVFYNGDENREREDKLNAEAQAILDEIELIKKLAGIEDNSDSTIPPTILPGGEIESAADSISAGGKSVKNFNITINDGLVNGVTNNFASSSDDPESAGDFMWKLSQALQMILNDVNYAAQ